MASRSASLLVVDDEPRVRFTLSELLRRQGHHVAEAADGHEALSLIERHPYDVLVLDLKMPGPNGIEVAQRARAAQPDVGIVLFTGAGSLETALDAMKVPVLDYVLKTSNPHEVVHRIDLAIESRDQALMQQRLVRELQLLARQLVGPVTSEEPERNSVVVGSLELLAWDHQVRVGERRVDLTPTEFRVLACLAQNAGEVRSASEIVRVVHGYDLEPLEAIDIVKPHISHLRRKIERDPTNPRYLLTVRGTGYMLVADDAADTTALA